MNQNLKNEKQSCIVYSWPELKVLGEYESNWDCARALNIYSGAIFNIIKNKTKHKHKILGIKCIIKRKSLLNNKN